MEMDIFTSITKNDLNSLKEIIQKDKESIFSHKNTMNPIYFAIILKAKTEIIIELIKAGSPLEEFVSNQTPLQAVCNPKRFELIEVLLKNGANPNNFNKPPPLFLAIKQKLKLEIIETLISYGADVKIIYNNSSILHETCKVYPKIDLIKLFLSNGADINFLDKNSPLHYIIRKKNMLPIIQLLVENDAKLDFENQNSILLSALKYQSLEVIQFLVNSGSKLDSTNITQVLETAIKHKVDPSIFEFLFLYNNLGANQSFKTIFSLFELCWRNKSSEKILDFLSNFLTESFTFVNENNLFQYVCQEGCPLNIVKKFYSDSLLNLQNKHTPLLLSMTFKKNTEIIEFLLEKNADVNIANGTIPCHFLDNKMKFETIESIVSNTKKINQRETPLLYAITNKLDEKIIELLLQKGSSVQITTHKTILDLYCENYQGMNILRMIVENGCKINHKSQESWKHPLVSLLLKDIFEIEPYKYLIEHGAKISDGFSPIRYSLARAPFELFEFLLQSGAFLEDDILYQAINSLASIEKIEMLIKYGANLDYSSYGDLLYAAATKSFAQAIQLLLKNGSPFKGNRHDTPIHATIQKHSVESLKVFIQHGINLNQPGIYPYLCYAIKEGVSLDMIKILIFSGANVNAKNNGDTALHLLIHPNRFSYYYTEENYTDDKISTIRILLDHGADWTLTNNKTPLSYVTRPEIIKLISTYMSVIDDMAKLIEREEMTDFVIPTIEGDVHSYKPLLQIRIGKDLFEKGIEILSRKKIMEVKIFVKFLCAGIIDNENLSIIQDIANEIGIDVDSKRGRNGILMDLKKLYEEEETKDFVIISNEEKIPVHKPILLARSELYRGMFLSVKDDSNQVNDYSGKSTEAVKTLIKFLYTDELDENISKEVFSELKDVVDYYLLNENSFLPTRLEEIRTSYKKDTREWYYKIMNEFYLDEKVEDNLDDLDEFSSDYDEQEKEIELELEQELEKQKEKRKQRQKEEKEKERKQKQKQKSKFR
ncbi:ankyrin repeat-containing protein [Anaeramoeba ignava]|uniref:Ankyrin repeat-containing protein n=1 Tax=Anaeramoeba ignava TaxID=1746090 RepID=A0A9Q0L9T2_ANAIG|nr:ankyrin repeat-containing protein [Anaeramoeba ignava]